MHCDCPTRSSNSLGGSRSINDEGLSGSGLSDSDSALPEHKKDAEISLLKEKHLKEKAKLKEEIEKLKKK